MDEMNFNPSGGMNQPAPIMSNQIGEEQVKKLLRELQKYKAGKSITERRIVAAENWWKLRNTTEESYSSRVLSVNHFNSQSGWLHNVITNKQADAIEAFPSAVVQPREKGDRAEASILTSIIPCILEANEFEDTYDDVMLQKMKFGTGVYKVTWDKDKLNGLGDISICSQSILNMFWEPGIEDIQKSRYVFTTELVDKDALEEMYPDLKDKLKGNDIISTRFLYDDPVSNENKVTVVECYYHRYSGSKKILHYVKFVGNNIIYATENDPQAAQRGLYDHGMYPFIIDPLFKIEGSICGYGYTDLCKNPQTVIDMLNTSFVKNAMAGATPRFFSRSDGSINEEEFTDLTRSLVHADGNLGDDSLKPIQHYPLDGVYVSFFDRIINELRETSGNTETATGSTNSGVTAASAIAALQQASGKLSRASTRQSYRSYSSLVKLVIELIRQFYDLPRQFRIVGQYGMEQYVTYSNQGLQPQNQGMAFGMDMGYRLPEFDISVSAQKKNAYTSVAQNEMAIQFYQLGFFNPQNVDQSLACIEMMDFDGKDELAQKLAQNGTMYQKLIQYMQLAISLAQKFQPELVQGLAGDIQQYMGGGAPAGAVSTPELTTLSDAQGEKEPTNVANAKARAASASQPGGK